MLQPSLNGMILTKFVNAFWVFQDEGAQINISGRSAAGIIAPVSGSYWYVEGDIRVFADKQHFVYVPKGGTYHIDCHTGDSILFNFQAQDAPEHIMPFPAIATHKMEDYYDRLVSIRTRYSSNGAMASMSVLYDLLFQCLNVSYQTDRTEALLEPAMLMMQRHIADYRLTCQTLAKAANISYSYFIRLFREKYGISPTRYIKDLRMDQARALLQEQVPVKIVAERVGYADIYQFSRAYKQYYGRTPSQEANVPE